MASAWVQHCPGFATYRWREDGALEVKGEGFPVYEPTSWEAQNIAKFWAKYGELFEKYASEYELPVSWVVGIVFVESGGDEWGCSPCDPKICSLAPDRCGGGVAKDGKQYVCCAYGLMQVIDANARHYGGFEHGAELLGNPDGAIGVGVKIYREGLNASEGDPLVAVRRYNGCGKSVCSGGKILKCNPSCMFGVGGQSNYAEKFARAVNTFLAMELPLEPVDIGQEDRASSGGLVAALGLGAVAAAAFWAGRRFRVF